MEFAFPTPSKARAVLRQLKADRANPDPLLDKEKFDDAWAGKDNLRYLSPKFQNGNEDHQRNIAAHLRFMYDARSKALEAVTKEREGYLNTFVLLVAAIGLVAQKQVQQLINSPLVLLLWVPAIALVMLLRSHASKPSALLDNYEGPGERSAGVTTTYLLVNELRWTLLRRNNELQYAKRNLAVVSLIYQLCILGACAYLTAVAVARMFD